MKESVFTIIAVLVLGTTTMQAQRYGGNRQNRGFRVENAQYSRGGHHMGSHGSVYYQGGGCYGAPRREVIVERQCRPCPLPPAPVRVVHHPVRPVHVIHRPAPVYVEPVCVEPVYVAPAPRPVVHHSSAVGIVAGAVVGTAIAALLCN